MLKNLTSYRLKHFFCFHRIESVVIALILTAGVHSNAKVLEENHAVGETMNGYRLKDFGKFDQEWHMVTVRYRKDSGELRFVYANDKAWTAINNHITDYPDGAIFAKIGARTKDDPAFLSSAIPEGSMRYQMMVKNKAKFASADGWGYALFDSNGKTFPEPPNTQIAACVACHRIVADRGFVFSQIMRISPFTTQTPSELATQSRRSRVEFSTMPTDKLPIDIRQRLPKQNSEIRMITGELRENIFAGTMDELRPLLAKEARRAHLPTALLGRDMKQYIILIEDFGGVACNGVNVGSSFRYLSTVTPPNGTPVPTDGTFCDAETK